MSDTEDFSMNLSAREIADDIPGSAHLPYLLCVIIFFRIKVRYV